MAGYRHQLGWAIESTPGTREAPSKFVRAISSTIKADDARIMDEGIIAGARTRRVEQYCDGGRTVAGNLVLPLFRGTELRDLFQVMGFSETGAGTAGDPYVYVPGAPASMTIQESAPDTAGVDQPIDFLGCYFTDWALNAQVGQKSRLEASVVGIDQDDTQTLATPSYATPVRTYSFVQANATVGGGSRRITSLNASGTTGLSTGERFLGTNLMDAAQEEGDREYKMDLQVRWDSKADLTTWKGGVGLATTVVATWSDGVDVLECSMTGFLESSPLPDRGPRNPLTSNVRLRGAAGTDAAACTFRQWAI